MNKVAASTTNSTTTRLRPVIVLAGWLGAQPKWLRRYEQLYQRLGFRVLRTRIAPPYAVVGEVLKQHQRSPYTAVVKLPVGWPDSYYQREREQQKPQPESVQEMAWDILASVIQEQNEEECCFWMFHCFSNGGCFVWERIREILLQQNNDDNLLLLELRRKLAGVVFDSSPIRELHRLNEALQHCSWMERVAVARHNGWDFLRMQYGDSSIQTRISQRSEKYVNGLRDDPLPIPQLYLYSRDDPLAPATFIDQLVDYRRRTIGRDKIVRRVWDTSMHCGHLLKHPQEYATAVESFVELCTSDHQHEQQAKSKL